MDFHPDFQDAINAHHHNFLLERWDLETLSPKVFNTPLNLEKLVTLKADQEQLLDLGAIAEERIKLETLSPVTFFIYTESTCDFGKTQRGPSQQIKTQHYDEFEIASTLNRHWSYSVLFTKCPDFFRLSSYMANEFEKYERQSFAALNVPITATSGYLHYLTCLQNLYFHTWLTCYIDYSLFKAYGVLIEDVLLKCEVLLQHLCKNSGKVHVGMTKNVPILYTLNRYSWIQRQNLVYMLAPGVVIGHTEGILKYGDYIRELMEPVAV